MSTKGTGREDLELVVDYLKGGWFYMLPIVAIIRMVLSYADLYTDIAVTVSWFRGGHLYITWAYLSMGLILMLFIFTLYRSYWITVEKITFDVFSLSQENKGILRMVLTFLQLHHIIMMLVTLKWWLKAYTAKHGALTLLNLPLVIDDDNKVYSEQRDGNKASQIQYFLTRLEDADSDSGWWKSYEMIWKGVPQLILQSYVLFLTRDISWLPLVSIAISIVTNGWSFVGIYNNYKLGGLYFNIVVVEDALRWSGMFIYCIGAMGMRVSVIAFLLVTMPTWGAVYCAIIFLTNQFASMILIFAPLPKQGRVMCAHALDDFAYKEVMESNGKFMSFIILGAIGGFGFLNLLIPIPCLVLTSWRFKNRHLFILINVLVRLIEFVVGIIVLFLVQPTSPCDINSKERYMECDACCRGPVRPFEMYSIFVAFGTLYLLGFGVWWPSQSKWLTSSVCTEWTEERTQKKEGKQNILQRMAAFKTNKGMMQGTQQSSMLAAQIMVKSTMDF